MRWLAALTICAGLSACDAPAPTPAPPGATSPPSASAPPASASSGPAAQPAAATTLQRRARPAELRQKDETACNGGDTAACRRMADRFRGYGPPAGCGVDRGRAAPFIKRASEDSDADDRAFVKWEAKVCDAGDADACDIERHARQSFPDSTADLEFMRLRSDPAGAAIYMWQKTAASLGMFNSIMKDRTDCLHTEFCFGHAPITRLTGFHPDKPEKVLAIATKICADTLECNDMAWMLDRNRVPLEARASFNTAAADTVVNACLDGACTCSQAAQFLDPADPRRSDLAQLACENGEAEGCYQLGRILELGQGLPKDEARALALYDLACPSTHPVEDGSRAPRLGEYSPGACDRLAEIHERGEMPPKEEGTALYYAELACSRPGALRDHAPCVRLARYHANTKRKTGTRHDDAISYFNGGKSGDECSRPSVKPLCEAHFKEIMGSHN